MTPRKQSSSSWLSYLLMGGILTFGAGAASLVLSDHASTGPSASAQKSAQVPRLPAPAASPAVLHAAQAPRAVKTATTASPLPSTTELAAPTPVASATPAQVTLSAPVPEVKAAVVSAKAVEVPAPIVAKEPATPAVMTSPAAVAKPADKPAPVVPPKALIAEPKVAVAAPKVVPKAVEAEPKPIPKVAEAAPKAAPVKKTAPVVRVAKQERVPVSPRQAVPTPKIPALAVPRADIAVPSSLPPEMLVKGIPKMENNAEDQGPIIAEAAPTRAAPSKVEPRVSAPTSDATALEPPRSVVKSARASPLVPSSTKPTVVMANGDKAWVKLDDQRTVIISKGQDVPGLGTFHGADKGAAKFDSGNVPLNQ